jgi:4-alpha-glucanotransferase
VRARGERGLLNDVPAELAAAERERAELIALLRSEELLPPADKCEPDETTIIAAMHRLLAATPSRLKLVSLYDVLAEPRQPNLPGTITEYPNWRIPLPQTLEQLRTDPRVVAMVTAFQNGHTPTKR